MKMAYVNDFYLHKHFEQLKKIMERHFNWSNIKKASDYADLHECTDITAKEGCAGVRIRKIKNMFYNEWTIRTTQMKKLLTSPITHYFYGWTDEDTVKHFFIIDMEEVRNKHEKVFQNTYIKNNDDGTSYYCISFNLLRNLKCIAMEV